jgi:hypothetical protein
MQCAEDGCRFFLVCSPAIFVGHPLVVLKLKVPLTGSLPVRRVHVVEGMGAIVSFGAFKPE